MFATISGLRDRASITERRQVAGWISCQWQDVAEHLEPSPLDEEGVSALEDIAGDDSETQANAMLDRWSDLHGKDATRYRLVIALIKGGVERVAEGLFGDSVKIIETSDEEY